MEDRRSEPSKEWNVSVWGLRNLGYTENIADIHKGNCRKTRSYRERQTGRKLKTVRTHQGWGSNTQSVTKFGL